MIYMIYRIDRMHNTHLSPYLVDPVNPVQLFFACPLPSLGVLKHPTYK
jgi:hypothetical protein